MARKTINEEITSSEVRNIVNSKIEDLLKDKEFEKRVKELTTDAMERFFRTMSNKRNVGKSEVKNG